MLGAGVALRDGDLLAPTAYLNGDLLLLLLVKGLVHRAEGTFAEDLLKLVVLRVGLALLQLA